MSSTYDRSLDYERLSNNLQRVLLMLLDGKWHSEHDLRGVGGARWSARVRSLREPRFGMRVEAERSPSAETSGEWIYRLDMSTVRDEVVDAIMSGKVEPVQRSRKPDVIGTIVEILNEPICDENPKLALIAIRRVIESASGKAKKEK